MSTRFTVWCDTHEESGPHIRRHHSSALFMQKDSARFFPRSNKKAAADEWGAFLIEHEYCDLRLVYEWTPAKTAPPLERQPRKWYLAELLEGWQHGVYQLRYRESHGGEALDWKGQALTLAEHPSDDDIRKPITRLPLEFSRFFGSEPQTMWLETGVPTDEGTPVSMWIDGEGYLRCEPVRQTA